MTYIFLDDIKSIVDRVRVNNPECYCYHIDVSNILNLKEELKTLLVNEKENSITIITEYGIKLSDKKSYNNVFEDILDDDIIKDNMSKISSIIVYSYQYNFDSYGEFRLKIKQQQQKQTKSHINIISKLTSASYVRQKPLYQSNGVIDEGELRNYEQYILAFVNAIISGCKDVLSEKNLDLERWLFLTNKFLLPNSSRSNIFKLGTISFLNPEDIPEEYAFDIPHKHYYQKVNDEISERQSNHFLKLKDDNDFNWIYLKILPKNKNLSVQISYSNAEHPFERDSELRDFWIKTLFTSIFYETSILYENKVTFEDWEVNMVKPFNKDDEYIEIYWFYHEHHYNFLQNKGFLNFTLYRKINTNNFNLKSENSNIDNEIEDLRNKAEKLYETNYKQIESKVLESIVPHYTKETIRQSKRNSKLDLAAYNISHTYSSHVYPFVENFLVEIQEHIYNLFDKISNINKDEDQKNELQKELEWFKNYYKEQLEKFTRLAINLSAANDRFNKEVDKMIYTTYKSIDLFNVKLAREYFSKLYHNEIMYENALSLGITDGNASCILDNTIGKDIKVSLPYGEIGVTMLMMLITNLFRNLKKHSKPSHEIGYKNVDDKKELIEYLNRLKTINSKKKSNYHYKVIVKEIKAKKNASRVERQFAEQYVKITFKEKSRLYNIDDELKLDGIEIEVNQLAFELTKRINDWSDENEGNWKGLKEIRMIASVLIGCPIEEIDFSGKDEYFEHKGEVFPRQLVEYEFKQKSDKSFEMLHSIYLRKAKFCTIWCSIEDKNTLNDEILTEWKHKGINIKVKGQDNPNPLASVPFVIDCESGVFDKIKGAPKKHFNFRFIKTDFETVKNCSNIEQKIRRLWVDGNDYLKFIKNCEYKNKGNSKMIFQGRDPERMALIDDHFDFLKSFDNSQNLSIENFDYIESNSSKNQNNQMVYADGELEFLQRETVNTKIVIYDEVILELIEDKKDKVWTDKNLEETLKWKNITVEKSITIDNNKTESLKQSFDGTGKCNLDDFINHINQDHSNHDEKLTYFILHYSGFEKIYKRNNSNLYNEHFKSDKLNFDTLTEKEQFAKAYKYLIDKLGCKGKSTYLVLCSGKFPNLLPNNAYFIDRQSLKYYIFDISSKIQLVNQLSGLRIQKYDLQ